MVPKWDALLYHVSGFFRKGTCDISGHFVRQVAEPVTFTPKRRGDSSRVTLRVTILGDRRSEEWKKSDLVMNMFTVDDHINIQ